MRQTEDNMLVRVIDTTEITFSKSNVIANFPLAQILFCESGEGYVSVFGGREIHFKKGDLIYLETALNYIFRTEGKVRMKKIACDVSAAPNLMDYFEELHLHILKNASSEIKRLYTELFEHGKNAAAFENRETSLKLYRLMIMVGQDIEENIGEEKLVLEAMARNYLEYMFRRYKAEDKVNAPKEIDLLFNHLYKMDAQRINLVWRLEVCRSYIAFGQPIDEVARYCGFGTVNRLETLFREHFGMSVIEYKNLF